LPCTKWRIRFRRNIQNLFVAQDEEIGYVALSWRCCRMVLHWYPHIGALLFRDARETALHSAEVGFGVGADVGEACWVGHAGGLAGFGVGPALALLEFDSVVVEELIDGDRGQHERQ
jgi:hypothetical protein